MKQKSLHSNGVKAFLCEPLFNGKDKHSIFLELLWLAVEFAEALYSFAKSDTVRSTQKEY